MGELLAAAIIGSALTVAIGAVVAVHGTVPARLVRLARLAVPLERRRLFDAGADVLLEGEASPFAFYVRRQERIAAELGGQIDALSTTYPEADIVVAVHPWEHALVCAMAQTKRGKVYGRFDVVAWDEPKVGAILRTDSRYARRGAPRSGPCGNGAKDV